MARRNKGGGGGHGGGGEERWLLPYADMITLLLGLFIVLFAMSSIDASKFDHVRRSLSQTFRGEILEEPGGVLDGASGVLDPEAANQRSEDAVVLQQLEQASDATSGQLSKQEQELEQVARQANLGNDAKVSINERGIKVSLAGDALFATGSSELRPEVKAKLTALERKLDAIGRPIEIAGHTDGVPFDGPHGNWYLSADRALAVLVFFRELGYRGDMHFEGWADTKPAVAPPRNNPRASMAANRRIEITVLAPGAEVAGGPDQGLLNAVGRRTAASRAAARGEHGADVAAAVEAEVNKGIVEELAAASRGMQ